VSEQGGVSAGVPPSMPPGVPAGMPVPPRADSRAGVSGVVSAGAGSALLFAAVLFHPLLFPIATFSPLPLSLQRLRRGLSSGLLAALLAASLLAGVFSPGQGLVFAALFALPGLLIAEGMARGRGLRRGALWAFLAVAAVLATALFFASGSLLLRALGPIEYAQGPEFLGQLKESGWTADMITQWSSQWKATGEILTVVYPAAYIIWGGFVVLANAALLRLYLSRRDPGWLDGSEFEGLRVPIGMAVAFVLAGGAVVFQALRPAAYNVLLVLAFFFGLQGLAVVSFYARRLAAPPLLRAAVVLLVLVNPWAPQILALMGLFDIWLDLRKYAEPPAETGA
jgi:uncharacterized protein YybS (DUF2232 family)